MSASKDMRSGDAMLPPAQNPAVQQPGDPYGGGDDQPAMGSAPAEQGASTTVSAMLNSSGPTPSARSALARSTRHQHGRTCEGE
jgi:hypothetical protein